MSKQSTQPPNTSTHPVLWELSSLGDGGASRPYPGSAGHCIAGGFSQ
ncbi:hypothetical protein ACT3TY_16160 [Halomonas sp. AOP22-C1-8]